ncbi:Amino-acid acetyltransferase, mitochondrial [Collariella sp. IMI 366227]|nr:Amino-acid acetyltransferase, mitochondrial [Collariella sp. IMI 366227]
MFARSGGVWKGVTSAAEVSIRTERQLSTAENGARSGRTGAAVTENHHPPATEAKQKRESDRQFLISVLESSATKRDAKAYLQTFGPSLSTANPKKSPAFTTVLHDGVHGQSVQGPVGISLGTTSEVPHIAIVKLREPQSWDDVLLDGVAKSLTQLRDLGLCSVIVLECDRDAQADDARWRETVSQQTDRIIKAIGRYSSPGAELVNSAIRKTNETPEKVVSIGSTNLSVGFGKAFTAPLRHGHIVVVPPRALCEETLGYTPVNANEVVFALTNFFSGLQFEKQSHKEGEDKASANIQPQRKAVVHRIIVIDPYGGIPASSHGDGARVFVNLEDEFDNLRAALTAEGQPDLPPSTSGLVARPKTKHAENLALVKNTLAILPSTASAIITSPAEAANLRTPPVSAAQAAGMPVTIFPNTRNGAWQPPKPGTPRLRLTDTCIDLPRLVHLINDSFDRRLDVEHYLRRVEDSLAGIIIAGEYEGGAILTWERPYGMDEEAAYEAGRLVPYLDKFAVLKKRQGAGGVADIVFNAMSNWAMFWTTPEAATSEGLMRDYEDVCRGVVPSWEDLKVKPAD